MDGTIPIKNLQLAVGIVGSDFDEAGEENPGAGEKLCLRIQHNFLIPDTLSVLLG